MLVGVPGSGKSTWISKQPFDWEHTILASTDKFVDAVAKRQQSTYSEVFRDVMPQAVRHMAKEVSDAVKAGYDIVWDQTSCTKAARKKKFNMLPQSYEIIGIVFKTPDPVTLRKRLDSRPGKIISPEVVQKMIDSWEEPTMSEGFSEIIYV